MKTLALLIAVAVGLVSCRPAITEEEVWEDWVRCGAKLICAEAGGVESLDEQAAVLWCAYNRVNDDRWSDDLVEVVTEPGQFASLSGTEPTNEMYELSADVFRRYWNERNGADDVGRTIPSDFFFFSGDGYHNYFRKEYRSRDYWDWSYPTVYGQSQTESEEQYAETYGS